MAARKDIVGVSGPERIVALASALSDSLPRTSAWFTDETDFRELRLKLLQDGSTMAIAKGYGSDGGEVVAFGVGYGVVGALMAIEGTIAGSHWKQDIPWSGSSGK